MQEKRPVGLLWDSISNNTGDSAMGYVMRRFCETRGIDYEVVNPFSYDPARYSIIIVGGGEIIRQRGDPFYDCYRVEGPHILNSAGVFRPDNVEYLRGYSLVTVRSEGDKRILQDKIPNVKVRPCVATLLGDLYPREEASEKSRLPQSSRPNIGVHLHWGTLDSIPDFLEGLKIVNQQYHITFIPFTLYNNDFLLMESMARRLPDASVAEARLPVDIYHAIGCLDGMIASSLHAGIFAIIQNVPTVVFPYAPKVLDHMDERGLRNWIFLSAAEMAQKVLASEFLHLDYTALLQEEKRSTYDHLDEMECLIQDRLASGFPAGTTSTLPRIERGEQAKAYFDHSHFFLALVGDVRARLITSEGLVAQRDQQLQEVANSASWQLLQSLRLVRLRLAPPGSFRESVWLWIQRGLLLWKAQGLSGVLRTLWRKLRRAPNPDQTPTAPR